MQAQFTKNDGNKKKWKKGKGNGKGNWFSNKEKDKIGDKPESSNKGGGGGNLNIQKGNKCQDKRKIQCYNCEKQGPYAFECWHGKGKQNKNSEKRQIQLKMRIQKMNTL